MHACINVCIVFVTSYYDGCDKLLLLSCFNTVGNDRIARNLLWRNEVVALNDTGFRFSSPPTPTLLVVTELSKHLVLNVSRLTFLREILLTLEGVNRNWTRSKEVTR